MPTLSDREGADMATIHDFQSRKKSEAPKGNPPDAELDFILASDVLQCPVDWLWRNRIARGKQTLIGGDPGVGKSQIVIDIIARITRGASWPDGGRPKIGNCLILSAEDAAKDTLCLGSTRPKPIYPACRSFNLSPSSTASDARSISRTILSFSGAP
jgi:hypothetical protein